MKKTLVFDSRKAFRVWLTNHHKDHEGIWIRFDKRKDQTTFKPHEALEEALCFGWIDSTIRRLDDRYYIKYFTKRRKQSLWSPKNKKIVNELIKKGLMRPSGVEAVDLAKQQGTWDVLPKPNDDALLLDFMKILRKETEAYENFIRMTPSNQKTYVNHYFSAKQDATKLKRLKTIVERLKNNLKPM